MVVALLGDTNKEVAMGKEEAEVAMMCVKAFPASALKASIYSNITTMYNNCLIDDRRSPSGSILVVNCI